MLFAGEHTVKEHPDTVGGALISGVREAKRVLGLLNMQEFTTGIRKRKVSSVHCCACDASVGRHRSGTKGASAQCINL